MAHNQTKPLSELLRSGDDSEPKKQSREEWRQAKELEEARKLGNAPAAVDETGKDINPHIPQYISTVPWYVGSSGPTLKHQRPQPEREKTFSSIHEGYHRGTFLSTRATKWRKGACENCGAMGHKKKDCMERPRARGARWTNEEIAPDDLEQPDLKFDFDGKRDRWNGYDPSQYKEVVEEYRRVEDAKRLLKEQKLKEETGEVGADGSSKNDDSDDEDKYADKIDMPGTKVDSKQRITVRNLRIREDTAKYLRNLDPDSAHYDPKTRSMRDNPYKNTGKTPDEVSFAGENFVRFSGDTKSMLQDQAFAWEAHDNGVDIHLLAEPTKAALLTKEFREKKQQVEGSIKKAVLDRYGGEEHLKVPPRELLYGQTEMYVEYSRTGQVLRGAEKKIVRSKYEEDVFTNNHSTVWGSHWEAFKWGYKCCHSFVKSSYCTGVAGKMVRDEVCATLKQGAGPQSQKKKMEKGENESDDDDDDAHSQQSQEREIESDTNRAARIAMPPPAMAPPGRHIVDRTGQVSTSSVRNSTLEKATEADEDCTDLTQMATDEPNSMQRLEGEKMKRKRKRKNKEKNRSKRSKKHTGDDDSSGSSSREDDSEEDSSASSSEADLEEERRRKRSKEEKRVKRREKKRRSKKHRRDKAKCEKAGEKNLTKAIKQYEEEQQQEVDERKRKYNSMYEHKAPTEADIEAYFLKRHRPEDPMAHFLQSNGR
ncbi:pre-mRNA-splicing factor SLU7-like [Tropilaelaps mercedesae]|uniref:Pre-mRNA-splicing factor SLU7 n=1 Tax=Tropilaelaps mercedesae TaxID=418985 RepID=A0A1V9XUS4_9ACAR|nr:pre-mRNA-splicing factor SLU7-like [Tropilaelaps mercedesae]